MDEVERIGITIMGTLPDDEALLEFDMEQKSLLDLPDDSVAVQAVDRLMEKIGAVIG
jgi:CO dehydrogenase maturation factor